MRQEKLLDETDWDLLIVLDDCRYDYFERIYRDYLKGNLTKAISPASNTFEWCMKVAGDHRFRDVVCVSANPHINSRVPVGRRRWDPRDKFGKIYDVWLTDWSDEMPTVMPEKMAERTLEVAKTRSERIMSWFIQPHAPFITVHRGGKNPFPRQEGENSPMKVGGGNLKFYRQVIQTIVETYFPLPLHKLYWEFQVKVRKISVGVDRVAYANLSMGQLKEAYEQNLRCALEAVKWIVENLPDRKIVITSDHGELLGDNWLVGKKIGHPAGYNDPKLREIPWLEVDGVAR